jgi:hypothetical protein
MDCPERLLIHKDGSASCPVPGCVEGESLLDLERALARHRTRVNCEAEYGTRCPRCGSNPDDRASG